MKQNNHDIFFQFGSKNEWGCKDRSFFFFFYLLGDLGLVLFGLFLLLKHYHPSIWWREVIKEQNEVVAWGSGVGLCEFALLSVMLFSITVFVR